MASRIDAGTDALHASRVSQLRVQGWTLVAGVTELEHCEAVLRDLGDLLLQYNGAIRHEVRFRPGFDDLQYSQSANAITPHTEAPGHDPPPRYLALHCHRQARCGGGHTLLADGYELIERLPVGLRELAASRPIRFDLAGGGSAAPVFSEHSDGTRLLRFSHNVLRDGSLEGPARDHDDLNGIDPFHAELCRRGIELMRGSGDAVLVPEQAVLIFDNWRMLHARESFSDRSRHLTRYWIGA